MLRPFSMSLDVLYMGLALYFYGINGTRLVMLQISQLLPFVPKAFPGGSGVEKTGVGWGLCDDPRIHWKVTLHLIKKTFERQLWGGVGGGIQSRSWLWILHKPQYVTGSLTIGELGDLLFTLDGTPPVLRNLCTAERLSPGGGECIAGSTRGEATGELLGKS